MAFTIKGLVSDGTLPASAKTNLAADIGTPGSGVRAALDTTIKENIAPIAVSASTRRGNSIVYLGDSNTASSAVPVGLMLNTMGQAHVVKNSGVAGNTTAQMLARLQADVIDHNPDWCVVMGGTNDTDAATAQTNLAAICEQLRAAYIEPILCTIPPANNDPGGKPLTISNWVKTYAAAQRIAVFDFYAALVDPATRLYKAGFNSDDVHMTAQGNQAVVNSLVSVAREVLPAWTPYLSTKNVDPVNLLINPLLLSNRLLGNNTTEEPSSPLGFQTLVKTGMTSAMVTMPGVPGRMNHMTVDTTATNTNQQQSMSTNQGAEDYRIPVTPGRRYRYSLRVQTLRCLENGIYLTAGAQVNTTNKPEVATLLMGGRALDAGDGVFSLDFTAPAGATGARVRWGLVGPTVSGRTTTAEVWFGQPTVTVIS